MATAPSDRRKSFKWDVNEKYTVCVHNDSPEITGASVVLNCFVTDKEGVEFKKDVKSKRTYIQFPVPFYRQTGFVDILKENLRYVMEHVVSKDSNRVSVVIDDLKTWKSEKFCTILLAEFLQCARSRDPKQSYKITLSFCATENCNFKEAFEICTTAMMSEETGRHQSGQSTGNQTVHGKWDVTIEIQKGSLDATKADVLACTISSNNDLTLGAVSRDLLKKAGNQLQQDLKKYYKDGIQFGKIAVLEGYKLECQFVILGVMRPMSEVVSKYYDSDDKYYRSSIREFMIQCLDEAERKKCRSIAFPAIGTGALKYPLDIVADEMFETVYQWLDDNSRSCLRHIKFVVFPSHIDSLEAFKEAEKCHGINRRQPEMKTTEFYLKSPDAHSRHGVGEYRILFPKGYTAELIQLYCRDTIDQLRQFNCVVEFKDDVGVVRGPPDVVEIEGARLRDAVKAVAEAFPVCEILDMTQSAFNQNDVRQKIDEVKARFNVQCITDKNKTKLGFFGKCWQDVKDAKARVVSLLLPPRPDSQSHQSKDVQQKDYIRSNSSDHKQSGINKRFSLSKYTEKVFETREKVTVRVYSADILSVPVDCIVNAANVNLAHGGGIARAIATAAGKDLTKEGREYLKKHGKLKVGEACSTSAGKMKYKCVVHAVGPCWTDYKPYTLKDVERCEADLYNAVVNSLSEAEQKNMQTVAVSSISSGIYGCPLDLCSVQYARAVLDYSKLAKTPLKEIHFVDTNTEMVQIMQTTFQSMIPDDKVPKSYNKLKYMKVAPKDTGTAEERAPSTSRSIDHQNKFNMDQRRSAQTTRNDRGHGIVVYPYCHKDYPPGQSKKSFACCFGPGQNLYIYSTDILSMTGINMIVCGNIRDGKSKAYLANKILEKGGSSYKTEKEKMFKKKAAFGSINVCPSGDIKTFKWVVHAILYLKKDCRDEEDRKDKVTKTFHRIFSKLTEKSCHSMALPLIGTGQGSGDPEYYAQRFTDGLLEFCSFNPTYPFQIHLVHIEKQKTQLVERTVDKAVRDARPLSVRTNHHKPGKFSSSQTTPARHARRPSPHAGSDRGAVSHHGAHGSSSWEERYNYQGKEDYNRKRKHNKEHEGKKEYNRMNSWDENTVYSTGKRINESRNENNDVEDTLVTVQREQSPLQHDASSDTDDNEQNEKVPVQSDTAKAANPGGNLNIIDESTPARQPQGNEQENEESEEEEEEEEYDDYLAEYPDQVSDRDDNDEEEVETCVICMDEVTDPRKLPCGHVFCTDCIEAQFTYKEACPTCGKVCGIITGDQPEGTMRVVTNDRASCAGFEDCGRIEISYRFLDGKQGPNHPNPGTRYKGITRTAYLPDNKRGKEICAMLTVAFDRKLVFTIGRSRTTGADGVITWNDIHHKTDPKPNSQFGYPDPTYLDRVTEELGVKGVTRNDLPTQSAPRKKRR